MRLAPTVRKFSTRAKEKLLFYVYLYIDPRDNKPFYVGKGTGNRCYSHLYARRGNRARLINELKKLGLKPRIDILKYGLTEKEALLVESTAIELLDLESLTNSIRGHGWRKGPRGSVEMVAAELDARPAKIKEPTVLITINREFRDDMGLQRMYDATRSAWKINPRGKRKPELALSIYRGVVREVFRIVEWVPGGTTLKASDKDGRPKLRRGRWEFVGHVAEEKVRRRYLGRSVVHYIKPGSQNPIRYIGC